MTVLEMPKFKPERGPNEDEFYDLVYNLDSAPIVFKYFPNAYFIYACDDVHDSRFAVIIHNSQREEFYVRMIVEKEAHHCLGFQLMIKAPQEGQKTINEVRSWLNKAKELAAKENRA